MKENDYPLNQMLWNIAAAAAPAPIVTDPDGSYTGRPHDPEERPIQDADDL